MPSRDRPAATQTEVYKVLSSASNAAIVLCAVAGGCSAPLGTLNVSSKQQEAPMCLLFGETPRICGGKEVAQVLVFFVLIVGSNLELHY